ncbi:MAG: hypothetical protein Q7U38_18530 [Methylobacter sp.]|nr:hypothetical protein [Methylobacter sp.]MDP2097916.1 hypothetical protein [Methylobacter sp.]MDP2429214.1 hypothetical protein [Methylobacter sp.]MDP3056310.1 hypothetical protein [Methylobacter sp.]MDP3362300.1 hypothetical protein [Methylobacter sp.]
MTRTITVKTRTTPWRKILQSNSTEEMSGAQFSKSSNDETILTIPKGPFQKHSGGLKSTSLDEDITENDNVRLPIDRIYPHIFDEDTQTGQAIAIIRNALDDAKLALEDLGEPNFQSVTTRLTQIAAAMSKAYPLTSFNESLGAVIAFIRRATLVASIDEISRPSLNALVHVLQSIALNPMIDLDDASDLVDKLSNEGWRGENGIANQLIAALLDDYELNTDEIESLLFQEK